MGKNGKTFPTLPNPRVGHPQENDLLGLVAAVVSSHPGRAKYGPPSIELRGCPMIRQIVIACALFCWFLFPATASTQQEVHEHKLNMKTHLLPFLFHLDVAPKSYFLKMVLRFGDSDTHLVVVVYPDTEKYWIRRGEIISYEPEGMEEAPLSQLISKMVAENPNLTAQEIAARLKVKVTRSAVEPEALYRALHELKAVRISPILASRVALDNYSEYEYWYDGGQESVHYTLTGPFKGDPQDKLVQWMIKFRANLPNLLKAPPPKQ